MRVVTLTCPGRSQRHLVHRMATEHQLVGCVWMAAAPSSCTSRLRRCGNRLVHPLELLKHLSARRANGRAEQEANGLEDGLFHVPQNSPSRAPDLPHRFVHDINHVDAVDFVKALKPDAILVNGTNLLREPWQSWASQIPHGIINIHTGLSPYSRGGNCNLFAILHGQLQCVGVTIHYIDAGIDSGEIIYTDRPNVHSGDTYESIETKVFRLGEDLAALILRQLQAGQPVPRIKQWTAGREFLKRTGYSYTPWQRVLANRRLHEQGLLDIYLRFRDQLDQTARTIVPVDPTEVWRHPAI